MNKFMRGSLVLLLLAMCLAAHAQGLPPNPTSGGPIPQSTYTTLPQGTSANGAIGTGSALGPVINVKFPSTSCLGCTAAGDAQELIDGVSSSGANATVTSAAGKYLSTDVNKSIWCINPANGALTLAISKITAVNSATQVVTNGTTSGIVSGLNCVWFTQIDTTAIKAAVTAASPSSASFDPNSQMFLPYAKTVYLPAGGYVVDARFYKYSASNGPCPNFIGEGQNKTLLFIAPTTTDPGDGGGILFEATQCIGIVVRDFEATALQYFPVSFAHSLFRLFNNVNSFLVENVTLLNMSGGASASGFGTIDFTNSQGGNVRNVVVAGSTLGGGGDYACIYTGVVGTVVSGGLCSNHGQTLLVSNNPSRTVNGTQLTFVGTTMDECGAGTACEVFSNNGNANFVGTTHWAGGTGQDVMNIDGTSTVWANKINCGAFGNSSVNIGCATMASGATFEVSDSDIRSANSRAAINGPAGANFVSVGGNRFQNCVLGPTCTTITAANYATQAFAGGIVSKSTETHSPNTCYAVTGNLLATAQNLCTILMDQNYQLLNITAQSGGTTPTNSACAAAPVITFSDGTRTATMTMTTAKTQWSSAVDSVTNINQVFAQGTTLTVSIGANTCATPATNVSVNYVMQSVLNP